MTAITVARVKHVTTNSCALSFYFVFFFFKVNSVVAQVLVTQAATWLYANGWNTSCEERSDRQKQKAKSHVWHFCSPLCLCEYSACDFIVSQMSQRSASHPPVERFGGADRFQQQKDYSIRSQTVICTKTQSLNTLPVFSGLRLLGEPIRCVCLSLFTCITCDWQHLCESDSSNGASDVLLRPLYSRTWCPGLLKWRWANVWWLWQTEVIFDSCSCAKMYPYPNLCFCHCILNKCLKGVLKEANSHLTARMMWNVLFLLRSGRVVPTLLSAL